VRVGLLGALTERSAVVALLLLELLVIGVGARLAFEGALSVGSLIAFHALFRSLSDYVSSLVYWTPLLLQGSGGLRRVKELLDEKPQVVDAPEAPPLPRLQGAIEFQQVTFSYGGQQRNLDGLSLRIQAGQSVALVGPSGSGKSTVLALMMRFYDPESGVVRLDGRDVREAPLSSLYDQMAVVFQETFLLNTTIYENIRMGRLDATREQIIEAARAAEIHDLIETLPGGYDTVVGERGGRLSGGQRQRIAIARAMVRDPAILILDEATSALDPETEASLNKTLARVARGRTVLQVTHRLASVVDTDRVFVLERGRLVEEGPHQELAEKEGGLYRKLWEKQGGFTLQEGEQGTVTPERLRTIPALASAPDALLQAMASRFVVEMHPAGRDVFQQGDADDRFYLLARGEISILARSPCGQERELTRLDEGDHLGEVFLDSPAARLTTARTRSPCLLLSLRREHLRPQGAAPQLA
jgi:ATP-binding cassette subfamily B protein